MGSSKMILNRTTVRPTRLSISESVRKIAIPEFLWAVDSSDSLNFFWFVCILGPLLFPTSKFSFIIGISE